VIQDQRFNQGELANDGASASSSEVGTPSFAVFSQKLCCLHFIVPMSSRELGVALRAGLLAALKPRKRVFPLAGCHP
jgi:hypothetical protein